MRAFQELLEDVLHVLGRNVDNEEPWNIKVEYIENLISTISNPYSRQNLKERYVTLLAYAKRVPTSRAKSYETFKGIVGTIAEKFVQYELKGREELGLTEQGFEVPDEEWTEEDFARIEKEKADKKAEFLKKNKKKPKPEEEELKD